MVFLHLHAIAFTFSVVSAGTVFPALGYHITDGIKSSFTDLYSVRQIHATASCFGSELDKLHAGYLLLH